MKRSEVNRIMKHAIDFCRKQKFLLPPFAYWSPADWKKSGHEADEIRDCMLGWDITDFGLGQFRKYGLILFTIRNGHPKLKKYRKKYCEKLLIVEEDQDTPMHFHWYKAEDIINRGGGNLAIQLYNSTRSGGLAKSDVTATLDGVVRRFKAGTVYSLTPGESICLTQGMYHKFWGKKGKGTVLVGEVSQVNDDKKDNRFHEPTGRFPTIEEDEAPLHYLCSEYPAARGKR